MWNTINHYVWLPQTKRNQVTQLKLTRQSADNTYTKNVGRYIKRWHTTIIFPKRPGKL